MLVLTTLLLQTHKLRLLMDSSPHRAEIPNAPDSTLVVSVDRTTLVIHAVWPKGRVTFLERWRCRGTNPHSLVPCAPSATQNALWSGWPAEKTSVQPRSDVERSSLSPTGLVAGERSSDHQGRLMIYVDCTIDHLLPTPNGTRHDD